MALAITLKGNPKMLEVEIQKLTAAIQELTLELKSAKVGSETATAEKSYREDDAARMEMQRKRDENLTNPVEDKAPKKSSPKKAPAPEPELEKAEAPADITADSVMKIDTEQCKH